MSEQEHNPGEAADHTMLLEFLADRDAACPACSYNLRGLTQPVCPECGKKIELRVGLAEGMSGSWITALVSSLLPAGIGLPFNVLLMISILFNPYVTVGDLFSEPEAWPFIALALYTMMCIPVSVLLLVFRRRFLRFRSQVQGSIAASLVLIGICAVFVLMVGIGGVL